MRLRNWAAWAAVGIAFTGCEHADPLTNETGGEATLSSVQVSVFGNCSRSGCHDGSGSGLPGVMDLRAGKAYASLVGVSSIEQPSLKRIDPGDPDNSYLIHKIEGRSGISGNRMPFDGPPFLSQEKIDLIRQWIADGALDN